MESGDYTKMIDSLLQKGNLAIILLGTYINNLILPGGAKSTFIGCSLMMCKYRGITLQSILQLLTGALSCNIRHILEIVVSISYLDINKSMVN